MANLNWAGQTASDMYQGIGGLGQQGYGGLGELGHYQSVTSAWPVITQTYTIQCSHYWNDPEFYYPESETKLLIQRCKQCNKMEILDL